MNQLLYQTLENVVDNGLELTYIETKYKQFNMPKQYYWNYLNKTLDKYNIYKKYHKDNLRQAKINALVVYVEELISIFNNKSYGGDKYD